MCILGRNLAILLDLLLPEKDMMVYAKCIIPFGVVTSPACSLRHLHCNTKILGNCLMIVVCISVMALNSSSESVTKFGHYTEIGLSVNAVWVCLKTFIFFVFIIVLLCLQQRVCKIGKLKTEKTTQTMSNHL